MKELNKEEIKKLNIFNDKLIILEEEIYELSLLQNQIALKKIIDKEYNIIDYELEVQVSFYGNKYILDKEDEEHLLADWTDNMKLKLMKESWWGINDKQCHNTTSVFQKNNDLNSQKHCWLLHSLYDHYPLDWHDIFMIDTIMFDIKIQYQYIKNFNIRKENLNV